MTAGPVNRALLESNFQNAGDVYSDIKTEACFDTIADAIDDNWDYTTSLVANGTLTPYPSFLSRQAIINGNFDVWQRGASFTNPSAVAYTADRWRVTSGGTFTPPTTITHSRQTLTLGDIQNSYYFYRLNVNGAGSAYGIDSSFIAEQPIENGTRYLCGAGKKVTISFWARSSISTKRLAINITQEYGSGGSPSATEQLVGTVFNLTSTWTKYTFTFTTNTLVGKTFGTNNDDLLRIRFWHVWGSNFYSRFGASTSETFVGAGDIDIAQVQVNSGDVALPFQPRSVSEELKLSQRYYRTIGIGASGIVSTTTTCVLSYIFTERMRQTPTVTTLLSNSSIFDGTSSFSATAGTYTVGSSSDSGITVTGTGFTGLTANRPVTLISINAIGLDAEL